MVFEALLEYFAKKMIDLGIKKGSEFKKIENKKKTLSGDKPRSIAGIWVCQYKYPCLNEEIGKKVTAIEKQVVKFTQRENQVHGTTLYAIAHPEDFEGVVTKDRFFTGLYFNKKNHHSYHGAFQFVISHSKNRMKGKWIGFNREGDNVDFEEWRWEQVDDNPDISKEKEYEYIAKANDVDLFGYEVFI